jgi:hypothetical protein
MKFNKGEMRARVTWTFQEFQLTHGSFGQQYATIDGRKYVTWFNLADRKLRGLVAGVQVEFQPRPAPTVLCHNPWVQDDLPSATLLRVVPIKAAHD